MPFLYLFIGSGFGLIGWFLYETAKKEQQQRARYNSEFGKAIHQLDQQAQRVSEVCQFRNYVLTLSNDFEEEQVRRGDLYMGFRHYLRLPAFEEMVADGKPLELSSYFPPAQVMELLTSKPQINA